MKKLSQLLVVAWLFPAFAAADCADLEHETWMKLDLAARCENDADCVVMQVRCPFGCQAAVNRESRETAHSRLVRYFVRCGACKQDCKAPSSAAACISGSCTIVGQESAQGKVGGG